MQKKSGSLRPWVFQTHQRITHQQTTASTNLRYLTAKAANPDSYREHAKGAKEMQKKSGSLRPRIFLNESTNQRITNQRTIASTCILLVAVHISLEWSVHCYTDIACLLFIQFFQLCAYMCKVEGCYFFIEVLWKNVNLVFVV
jgi:hypothetical protein